LRTVQIPFALGQVMRAKTFNRILSAAKGTAHERLVHEVVLRSQAQALYHPKNAGHFGLGLANYAHFTSPIRRYADLIVHRALIAGLRLGEDGLSVSDIAQLEETADLISAAERRAMIAERETVDRLAASFLAGKLGATFEGRISGVVGAGVFVVLNETGADGFLPVSALGHERFELHQARHALIGARSKTIFQLGAPITVRLVEVAPLKGGLKFELTDMAVPAHPARAKGKARSRKR
jgi:ribonuclease R